MARTRKSTFFSELLRDRKRVGSVYPSGKALSRRMISTVDWDQAKVIVELGPGDGCITREILKKLKPHTTLLLFETSKAFCEEYLDYKLPNVHVINDTAEKMGEYLKKYGLGTADYIISSLPLTNFPEQLKKALLDESLRNLKPGGIYMQYQYLTTVKRLLNSRFKRVKISWVPRNFPPAFVYTCWKEG